jgi:F-type H+-transporting ATPase subunit b
MKAYTKAVFPILLLLMLCAGTAFAAAEGHEGGETWNSWMLLWRVINTAALVALLIYFLKKPMANFFSERHAQIRKDLEDAKAQRDRAERTIADYEKKIGEMEHELEKMRVELRKTADAESQKIVSNADRMAASMVESAKVAADQEVRKAKIALKNEAVGLAVELAESLIREKINEDDRKRIVEEYLVKVGGMK